MNGYCRILEGRYVDSVVLMRLAQSLAKQDGVDDAAAVMGTDANRALLREGGFVGTEIAAGANDLIVSVRADSGAAAQAALARVDELLAARIDATVERFTTIDAAVRARQQSNVVAVSLPGEYAADEARRALELGRHVFLFSSNVTLEDELDLKALARDRGLLCMGPDCGTAIVAGKGLGFANEVRRGPVGIVGASGTGIQVVSTLLEQFGIGVSHAIGCGSRDLSEAVGGVTALAGLEALARDDSTQAIVLISKPAPRPVTDRLRACAAATSKPVVFGFLGDPDGPATLTEMAQLVAAAVGEPTQALPDPLGDTVLDEWRTAFAPGQRYIRGLYAGGTLAYEAQLVLRAVGLEAASNAPLRGAAALRDVQRSEGHTILDLGSEELTRGRPHPMIDARARSARLVEEAADPEVAAILLDVVLGYGAAADPAGDLVPAIIEARRVAHSAGRELAVLAYVCGTSGDPQGLEAQQQLLLDAGVVVVPTSASLAEAAVRLLAGIAAPGEGATPVVTGGRR